MSGAIRSGNSSSRAILILLCSALMAVLIFPRKVQAFGAGNIPSISAIEGKNFRHGDIEDILATLVMTMSGNIFHKLTGGKKFNEMAIKRVYFGNWLRDYSQAVDVGTLSKGIELETIRVLIWVMSFLAFGYATEEFEVTKERLGTYRPEEHIDNPKDYADNKDARQYDSRLRGPVALVELEIDNRTGMKNYIANDNGGWATSRQFIKSSIKASIHHGRMYSSKQDKNDHYEALRLLGQSLHCLEDFSAHSNFIELTLRELGNRDVFPHVGSQTMINLNGKQVYPLVTGTFGSLDFLHSMLGEAQDHLSQTEIEEVNTSISNGKNSKDSASILKSLLGKLPISLPSIPAQRDIGGSSSRAAGGGAYQSQFPSTVYGSQYSQESQSDSSNIGTEIDNLTTSSQAAAVNANNMSVDEIVKKIYPFLAFRDRIMKGIDAALEKVPFLNELIDKISEQLTIFVMGLIAPFITPLIEGVLKLMQQGSQTAVDNKDQEEVWHNPTSHNPTHSYLSKDHFSLYLNEPAGLIAKEVVAFVVPMVVEAWENYDISDDQVVDHITEVFHHPAMCCTNIQQQMRSVVEHWLNDLGSERSTVLRSLTSDGVLHGANHVGGKPPVGGHSHGSGSNAKPQKHKPSHNTSSSSGLMNSVVNQAAQSAGLGQYVSSSGINLPSAGKIASKFNIPGANLLGGKIDYLFRENDQNRNASVTSTTSFYHASEDSRLSLGDISEGYRHPGTVGASSDYYSQESSATNHPSAYSGVDSISNAMGQLKVDEFAQHESFSYSQRESSSYDPVNSEVQYQNTSEFSTPEKHDLFDFRSQQYEHRTSTSNQGYQEGLNHQYGTAQEEYSISIPYENIAANNYSSSGYNKTQYQPSYDARGYSESLGPQYANEYDDYRAPDGPPPGCYGPGGEFNGNEYNDSQYYFHQHHPPPNPHGPHHMGGSNNGPYSG
ncbi:heterokaryon incompatibility protein Het-C-domain-containing protein [Dipodascopsis uninucleata]